MFRLLLFLRILSRISTAFVLGCAVTGPRATAAETATAAIPTPAPLPSHELHNLFRVTPSLYSGSSPDSDAAFAELKTLGVTTVISVDGSKPNIEKARQHGLRYVHLPIGYDGISALRQSELIRAARSTTGAVYVHCHHGRHRGPAAAAVIGEGLSGWSPDVATQWLRSAGTSPDYAGLYRSVRDFQKPLHGAPAHLPELPEVAPTPPLVDSMVAIDSHVDYLKAAGTNAWKALPNPPDRTPRQEATLLWEQWRELARHADTSKRPESYRNLLTQAEGSSAELAAVLKTPEPDRTRADASLRALNKACTDCHKAYRN